MAPSVCREWGRWPCAQSLSLLWGMKALRMVRLGSWAGSGPAASHRDLPQGDVLPWGQRATSPGQKGWAEPAEKGPGRRSPLRSTAGTGRQVTSSLWSQHAKKVWPVSGEGQARSQESGQRLGAQRPQESEEALRAPGHKVRPRTKARCPQDSGQGGPRVCQVGCRRSREPGVY